MTLVLSKSLASVLVVAASVPSADVLSTIRVDLGRLGAAASVSTADDLKAHQAEQSKPSKKHLWTEVLCTLRSTEVLCTLRSFLPVSPALSPRCCSRCGGCCVDGQG